MKTIHHVLDIGAAVPVVWSALTEPAAMAGWWSTKVRTPPAAVGALVEWRFVDDFNPVMEITQLSQGRRLEWRCISGHSKWADTTFQFELDPLGATRTRLRFWQIYASALSDEEFGVYNFNWGYYLESLRLLCGTGSGRPYRA